MFLFDYPLGTTIFFFFRKELPKSCNYHFIFVKQNQLVLLISVSAGWEVGEVSVGIFFRHCHPVSAADCEPCRPRSTNL